MDAIKATGSAQRRFFKHPLLQLFTSSAPEPLQALQCLITTIWDGDSHVEHRARALEKLVRLEQCDSSAWSLAALIDELIESALADKCSPLVREQLVLRQAHSAGLRLGREPLSGPSSAVPSGARFIVSEAARLNADDVASHRHRLACMLREAVHDLLLLGDSGVRELSVAEAAACTRLLQLYVSIASEFSEAQSALETQEYLSAGGAVLWDRLIARLGNAVTGIYGAGIKEVIGRRLGSKLEATAKPSKPMLVSSLRPGWHTVVRDAIPQASDPGTQETLARYERLRTPMAVASVPSLTSLRSTVDQLRKEFPWATSAVDALEEDLVPRAAFGGIEFGLTPTLLYGPPGCGKSRLARRVAELTGVPSMALPMAGATDARVLLGTARGWADGQPSPIIELLHRRQSASALVLIDEVDKCAGGTTNSVAPAVALLALLEPENSTRWFDTFLQAHCDLSKVAFWATANDIQRLSAPLLSRFRPIQVPMPTLEDFAAALDLVVADTLSAWGLPAQISDGFDARSVLRTPVRNLRELQAAVRSALSTWIRAVAAPTARH